MLQKAFITATQLHSNQTRKDSNLPYIIHPMRIVDKLYKNGHNDETILTAAILHDVLEDCNVDKQYLIDNFNQQVADIVEECSNLSKMNKLDFSFSILNKSKECQIIKAFDKLDNIDDFNNYGNFYTAQYILTEFPIIINYCRMFDDLKIFGKIVEMYKSYVGEAVQFNFYLYALQKPLNCDMMRIDIEHTLKELKKYVKNKK